MFVNEGFGDIALIVPDDDSRVKVDWGLVGAKEEIVVPAGKHRGLWTPDGGDIHFITTNGNELTFTACPAGFFMKGAFKRIFAADTTGTWYLCCDGVNIDQA